MITQTNIIDASKIFDDNDYVGKVYAVTFDHRHNSWILDFGTTFYICPHKNLFATYKQMSETIYLGDNNLLEVEEIDNIKLKNFYGIIINIECWNVPRMKKNLISLSTLDN